MSTRDNPWVMAPDVQAPPAGPVESVGGARPVAWRPGADVRVLQGLPIVDAPEGPGLWVVGAHGGAGATSWARLLGAGDAGVAWPRPTHTVDAVVVARSNRSGLRAAQFAAIQWASGVVEGVNLLALLLVADAPGRMPKEVREFARLVKGAFPQVIEMGWEESWRVQEAWEAPMPREAKKAIEQVQRLRKEHS